MAEEEEEEEEEEGTGGVDRTTTRRMRAYDLACPREAEGQMDSRRTDTRTVKKIDRQTEGEGEGGSEGQGRDKGHGHTQRDIDRKRETAKDTYTNADTGRNRREPERDGQRHIHKRRYGQK